jgi:DNA-binding NarL/FixJ family response regulator
VRTRSSDSGLSLRTAACFDCDDLEVAQTVLIVDDHSGFRAQARILLEREGYVVVGEAPDGRSAITAARHLAPDLVLLDVLLPDLNGFEVATALRDLAPRPAVVLVSTRDASDYGRRIERSGADGFISKADLSGATLRALTRNPT